ncbi:MAG: 30S ribosomal protein S17 [Caldiserica bacterium]|nr:30S ribosomal protein S17 [Caldisericota bacterium]
MGAEIVEKGIVLKAQDGRVVVGVKRMVRGNFGHITVRTTKLYADDSRRISSVGDTVVVRFTHPISSSKRWRLIEVVTKAGTAVEGARNA